MSLSVCVCVCVCVCCGIGKGFTYNEMAACPAVFLTAYYAMFELVRS